jgi:hypothetical protein
MSFGNNLETQVDFLISAPPEEDEEDAKDRIPWLYLCLAGTCLNTTSYLALLFLIFAVLMCILRRLFQ